MAKRNTADEPQNQIPEAELHLVHACITKPGFNPLTGEPLYKAFVQKFTVREWNDFAAHGPRQGYEVKEVIHAPDGTDLTYPAQPKSKKK